MGNAIKSWLLELMVVFVYVLTTVLANEGAGHGAGHGSDSGAGHGSDSGTGHGSDGAAEGHEVGEEGHESYDGIRYYVAKFDFTYVRSHFIIAIWVLYASGAKIFFHSEKYLSKIFPESCMLIVIGVLLGIILYFVGHKDYELQTTSFFLVLLPPIILDAGYFMPARPFFDQLGTILLYAILGTLVNTIWLGFALWGVYEGGGFSNLESPLLLLHSLTFAALLAAVDPVAVIAVFESVHVNDMLYIVVFGESLLNDGISVVLYHMFEGFSAIGQENLIGIDIVAGIASFFVIVFGAVGIGILLGLFGGFLSRFSRHVRIMEPLLVFVIGYLSFLIAEMFHLSGILSCTFCGITMRKYVEANISHKSKGVIKTMLKMAATVSEIVIFMLIGITAVSDTHHWDTAFCLLTLIFCLIFRALGVILLTWFANMIRVVKLNKIDQFIMAYGGLRGAIAFALVLLLDEHHFPHRKMFITSTVLVIYFTNLGMGTTIKPLVTFLKVKLSDKSKPNLSEKITHRAIDHVMAGIEDICDEKGHHLMRERYHYLNNYYLKPLICGKKNPQRRGWQVVTTFNRLNEKATRNYMSSSPSFASLYRGQTDLSRASSVSQLTPSPSTMNHMGYTNWHGSNGSLPHHGGAETPDSLTKGLDLMVVSRKMKDESKTHHMSEDVSLGNKSPGHYGPPPFSPHAPIYTIRYPYSDSPTYDGAASPGLDSNGKPRKIVSFADIEHMTDAEVDLNLSLRPSTDLSSDTPGLIVFTTRSGEASEPTAVESIPPWKRQTIEAPLYSPSARATPPQQSTRWSDGATNEAFQLDEPPHPFVSPTGSSSSSSSDSGQEEDGNTNNNNRGSSLKRRPKTLEIATVYEPEVGSADRMYRSRDSPRRFNDGETTIEMSELSHAGHQDDYC